MEEIEAQLRQAKLEDSPIDQFRSKSARTSLERYEASKQKDEKVMLAFDAGYRRGRIDHMKGAFGHAAVFVWVALIVGMLAGAGLTYIGQYAP